MKTLATREHFKNRVLQGNPMSRIGEEEMIRNPLNFNNTIIVYLDENVK